MDNDDNHELEVSEESHLDVPMLATHTLNDIELKATTLCVDKPEADIQTWLNLATVLVARAKEIRCTIEQVAIEWIEKNGPIQFGDIEYTVGHNKTARCIDVPKCASMILECAGGDLASIILSLRTDPFKYGTVRSLIGEANFSQVFRTEIKPKLLFGTPQLQLQKTNLRFIQPRTPHQKNK